MKGKRKGLRSTNAWFDEVTMLTPNEVREILDVAQSCSVCTQPIVVMTYKGTGFCSQRCEATARARD